MTAFHKKTLDEWNQILRLRTEDGKAIVDELVSNCGIEVLEGENMYRCRWNLSASEILASNFDSPPLEAQKKTVNRFQPTSINCLYAAQGENFAVLEVLPIVTELEDVFYTAKLTVKKPLKLLDLTNSIGKRKKSGEREWDYKPIFGQMFFVDDYLGYTNIIETTRLLSEFIYRQGLDGIIYLARGHYIAKVKQGELSFPRNYVIYGSPVNDGRLSVDVASIQKHELRRARLQ